jgi:hypothetical protein
MTTKGSDHHSEGWRNEFSVLVALASINNEPSYIGKIWMKRPSITSLDTWQKRDLTKPGAKAACLRLFKQEILAQEKPKVKDLRVKTNLYHIEPTIGTLATISKRYGSPLLNIIRESSFGQGLIASSLPQYVVDGLTTPTIKEKALKKGMTSLIGMIPEDTLQELVLLASISTRALQVCLDDVLLHDLAEADKPTFQLISAVQRLENILLFNCVAEMIASPRLKFYDGKWILKADLNAEIGRGRMKMAFRAKFDSDEYMKNLKVGWEKAEPT